MAERSSREASGASYLVIGFGGKGVGDHLVATSFVRNLFQNEPGCSIDFAASSPVGVEILQHNPYIRNLFVLDTEYVKFSGTFSWGEKREFLNRYRRLGYDKAYVLSTKFRHALFAYLIGARERIGYESYHRGFLLTKKADEPTGRNMVERFLHLLTLDGMQVFDPAIELFLSDKEVTAVEGVFLEKGVGSGDRVIALAPFAADMRRTWGLDRFWQVAEHFAANGFTVVVLGAPSDRALMAATRPIPRQRRIVDLVGALSLLETAAVIKRSAAFLGNDSGLGHMAGAVNTKALILGYFITRVWYPLAPSIKTIIKETGCTSCDVNTCIGNKDVIPDCFLSIRVDEVIRTLTEMVT